MAKKLILFSGIALLATGVFALLILTAGAYAWSWYITEGSTMISIFVIIFPSLILSIGAMIGGFLLTIAGIKSD